MFSDIIISSSGDGVNGKTQFKFGILREVFFSKG